MSYDIDFSIATSRQIERALCERLERFRLSRNMTQERLAEKAGVSIRTIGRLASGEGITLDTLIRIMIALGIQSNLEKTLPDPSVRPIERVENNGLERRRARPTSLATNEDEWSWGDEENGGE